jgi:hypothetical protein
MREGYGNHTDDVRRTMWWVASVWLPRGSWMWPLVLIWTLGCGTNPTTPSIAFTKVPAADRGGPDLLDTIEGRITRARPDQRLVLYARSSVWWVQPDPNSPYTEIRKDSTFSTKTHLGTEYAALLVEPNHQPPTTLEKLPPEGGSVVRVAVVPGNPKAKAVRHTLQFAGYEWIVRAAPSDRGGPNQFDPANAWTDGGGAVHLRIAGTPGRWTCAELALTQSFGYGLYTFTVDDISRLDPAARFVIFTWDGPAIAQYGREMAITIGRHGERPEDNARYVIEPIDLPANRSNFFAPAGLLTHQLRWEPDRATFRTFRGARANGNARPVAQHTFTSGVPGAGNETIRFSLYVFQSNPTPMQKPAEVVVRRFTFEP